MSSRTDTDRGDGSEDVDVPLATVHDEPAPGAPSPDQARASAREDVEQDAPGPRTEDAPPMGRPLNRRSPFLVGLVGGFGVFLAYGLVTVVQQLSSVITLVVVALFLALGLDPVVKAVQRRVQRRGVAVLLVLLAVLLVFVGVIALLVPPVVKEATQLAQSAPDYVQNLLHSKVFQDLDRQYGIVSKVQQELQKRATDQTTYTSLFGGVLGAGKAVVSGLFSAFTVLILTLYLLASLPAVKRGLARMAPASRRPRLEYLGEEVSRRVGGYFLGQVGVATVNAVCSFVMMKIVGVPYAAVLAVCVGLLGLIPMVGATIGAVLVALVALFQSGLDAVVVAVYYVVYQQFENYVVAPRVMSRTVAVPGAITVVAALAGGTLLGVLGALLAIPVAASLLLVYEEVLVPRQQRH